MQDLWGLKTIIEVNFPDVGEEFQLFRADRFKSPEAEMRALKGAAGGFKLAFKLITEEVDYYSRALFVAGSACWSAHSKRAELIKSPKQGLVNILKQSRGGWKTEVLAIAYNALRKEENLETMGLMRPLTPEPFDGFTNAHVLFSLHLMGNRAWSLKLEFESPPQRYASTLDANAIRRNASGAQMQREFHSVLKLERDALKSAGARALRKKAFFLDNPSTRMPYHVFERCGNDPLNPKFQRLMTVLHKVIPDSRIVEEVHQYIRDKGRNNKNFVISRTSRFNACRTSGVLERREMQPVQVSKQQFVGRFSQSRQKPNLADRFKSSSHRLPASWSNMMRPTRTWASPDNINSRIPFGPFCLERYSFQL